ncbi:MAG TPA: hypothetical protein VMV92_34155 [Streptosporangiaceae bacterium]|nr:hypothetical protein [Streptosporangiaceae bacterium]
MAFALLLGSVAAALLLARGFHQDVAQTSITVLVGGGTLPALYLAWAAYRDAQDQGDALSLGELADQLAVAVGDQWKAEAAVRRLNDPYPLPVRWVAADGPLVDSWDLLMTLAASGAGWPSSPSSPGWACGPAGPAARLGWPGAGAAWRMCWPGSRPAGLSCSGSRARERAC